MLSIKGDQILTSELPNASKVKNVKTNKQNNDRTNKKEKRGKGTLCSFQTEHWVQQTVHSRSVRSFSPSDLNQGCRGDSVPWKENESVPSMEERKTASNVFSVLQRRKAKLFRTSWRKRMKGKPQEGLLIDTCMRCRRPSSQMFRQSGDQPEWLVLPVRAWNSEPVHPCLQSQLTAGEHRPQNCWDTAALTECHFSPGKHSVTKFIPRSFFIGVQYRLAVSFFLGSILLTEILCNICVWISCVRTSERHWNYVTK